MSICKILHIDDVEPGGWNAINSTAWNQSILFYQRNILGYIVQDIPRYHKISKDSQRLLNIANFIGRSQIPKDFEDNEASRSSSSSQFVSDIDDFQPPPNSLTSPPLLHPELPAFG